MVHMYRSGGLPKSFTSAITLSVLPCLIKLFWDSSDMHTTTVQERAIRYFSSLVADDEELQKVAMDSDAIIQLSEILKKGPPLPPIENLEVYSSEFLPKQNKWDLTEEVRSFLSTFSSSLLTSQAIFLALGAVTSMKEENRRQVSLSHQRLV